MPDQSSGKRAGRPRGAVPGGGRGRLRDDHGVLSRRRARRTGQGLRPRCRRAHERPARQPRRLRLEAVARPREDARFGRAHRARAQVRRSERYEDALVEISWRASSIRPTCRSPTSGTRARSCAPRTRLARRQDRARAAHRARALRRTARLAERDEAPRVAGVQRRVEPRRVPHDRAVLRPERALRSGVPRRDGQRRPPQPHARGRPGLGDGDDADVLPRHRAEDDHDHPGHRGEAPRSTRTPSSRRSSSATPT